MPTATAERRIVSSDLSLRTSGGRPQLVGHAAVFNRDSELLDGTFIERIAPGAFRGSIERRDDVRALINHDATLILGRTTSGTLTLREDDMGLLVRIDPPNTSYAKDLLESTKRGDISQMSFGFQTVRDRWERGVNGKPDVRILLEVNLFDVSAVTYPAYPDTDVAVRSHQRFIRHAPTGVNPELEIYQRRLTLEIVASGLPFADQELDLRRRRLTIEALAQGGGRVKSLGVSRIDRRVPIRDFPAKFATVF